MHRRTAPERRGVHAGRHSLSWQNCGLHACRLPADPSCAGMLALPKAMEQVGVVLGFVLFGTVCLLTYFSSSIIIK